MIFEIKKKQNKKLTQKHFSGKSSAGFTLPELLTGVTLFSLIIGITSGLFISAIRAQRKSLAYQELLDQTSYLQERMSRALRMAKKDLSGDCITQGKNYENPGGDNSKIRFLDYEIRCHEFFQDGDVLKERKSSDESAAGLGFATPLTGSNLKIITAKFHLTGESQTDNLQPRVTILLKVKGVGEKPEEQPEIIIQTGVSQRNLDVVR
jgi:prepilin-type N-terminal cleavage/methylation domain-containing protein